MLGGNCKASGGGVFVPVECFLYSSNKITRSKKVREDFHML